MAEIGIGDRMHKQRRQLVAWVLVSLLVLWIAAQFIVSAVRYSHKREGLQRAEAWLHEAQRDAKSDMIKEDAIRWLRLHGADRVYLGATAIVNGKQIEWHVVAGDRKINQEEILTEPITAHLEFHFDTQWQFKEVTMEIRHY